MKKLLTALIALFPSKLWAWGTAFIGAALTAATIVFVIDMMEYSTDLIVQNAYLNNDGAVAAPDVQWRLENVYTDSGSGGYTITPVGSPTFPAGHVGTYSLLLNGTTQNGTTSWNPSKITNGSISVWFKTTDTAGTIIAQDAAGYNDLDTLFGIGAQSVGGSTAGHIAFETHGPTSGDLGVIESTEALNDGAWHHAAITVDGVNYKLYIDGRLDASNSTADQSGLWGAGGSTTVLIGVRQTGAGYYAGNIDDLRVHNSTLTNLQIASIYNDGVGKYADGAADLISYAESTIKTQGSYSLKLVAASTARIGDIAKRSIPTGTLDLSGKTTLRYDLRSTVTGINFQLRIKDYGGTESATNPTINSADTWEAKTWNIGSIADADKDNIEWILFQPVGVVAWTFYVDNVRAD